MQIELSKTDLRWAHWRNIPPEPRPVSTSFSYDTALKKLQKLKQIRSNEHQINWHTLKLNIGMSREEAHFWIEAMFKGSGRGYSFGMKTVVDYMSREDAVYDGKIGLQELLNSSLRPSKGYKTYFTGYHVIPLFVLLNLADFLAFFNESVTLDYIDARPEEIFRLHILPYLNNEEKAAFRMLIAPYIAANDIKLSKSPGLIGLAALIGGMDAELENYLNRDFYHWGLYYEYVYDRLAIFGLSSREKVEHYVRSKKQTLYVDDVQAWLAHTELNGLDWLARSIAKTYRGTNKSDSFKVFKTLLYPQAVLPVLSLWEENEKFAEALKWLVDNPKLVAETLVPLLFTEHPQASLIQKYLRRMVSMQQGRYLEAAMQNLTEAEQAHFRSAIFGFFEARQELDESSTPKWLKEALAQVPVREWLVKWVDILALPPLTVKGIRLNPDQIKTVIAALSSYDQVSFLELIKEYTSLEERENFVWGLFQSWLNSAASHEDSWVLRALAKFGEDNIVIKLIPLIERWPGQDHQNRNAKAAIDTLVNIGSDTAYIQLKKLMASKKLRSASIRQKIDSGMQTIARMRGLNQLEFEDRLISDCGLDKNASRTFNFGSRKFTLVLSADLKPVICDAQGKIIKGFPTVLQGDDSTLAAQAEADWNSIKTELKDLVKAQTNLLESAMTWQRRWNPSDFQQFYLQHPVMSYLARRLLWASYDKAGKLIDVFRVDELGRWLNVRDFAISKGQIATVGIVHAAELSDKDKQAWGEILHDYEIIPPFPQLSYKVNQLEADELELDTISRFATYKIEGRVLESILEKSRWRRVSRKENITYFNKSYFTPKIIAVIKACDIPNIVGKSYGRQIIESCHFVPDKPGRYNTLNDKEAAKMCLGDVPPVVLSETLRILYAVAAKAD